MVVLGLFAVVFTGLAVFSYTQQSATWDEPQHLTSGYLALANGDYRLDPEHPPLLRMWAALPLLAMRDIRADPSLISRVDPTEWVQNLRRQRDEFAFSHEFLYKLNDADRLLYAARAMIVLLGVLVGVLLFCWAREWLGFWPATIVLGLYTIEPNLQAHASLVTTDFGIAGFIFGAVYFLWRSTRSLSAGNLAGTILFCALAAISKFSALALAPMLGLLLLVPVCRRQPWSGRLKSRQSKLAAAAGIALMVVVTSWFAIWAVYGFRHAPSHDPAWLFRFDKDAEPQRQLPRLTRIVRWLDAHRWLPNAYCQGFLLGQTRAQVHKAYFAGEVREEGWWFYFPVAFVIKTPVALIALLLFGLTICAVRWRALGADVVFVAGPPALFLAIAMAARLNIGLRHILPVFPFALLLAGAAARELLRARRPGATLLAGLCLAWLAEFARVYPHDLAFFSQIIGGPRNGYKYLADSNLDWGQDLKGLAGWMKRKGIEHINLSYFGTADPEYYGIRCTYIAGAPFWIERASLPQLPGYVAVSAQFLTGAGLNEAGRRFYAPLRQRKPDATIGYSIYIYRLDRGWWDLQPDPALR